MVEKKTSSQNQAIRDCRQCYGSGECFQCSGDGSIPAEVGGRAACHSCGGGGKRILCSGRGEVTHPMDEVFPGPRPASFAS